MERSGFSYKLSREPAFCGVLVSCKGNPSVLKATSWDKEPTKRVHSGGGGERWTALLCDDSPPRAWSGIQALPSVMPASCPCWKTLEILEEERPWDPQTSGQMSSGGIPPIYPNGRVRSISRNILPFSKARASFGLSDKSPGSVK